MADTLTVVVPAYNERESLERLLPNWLRWCGLHSAQLIVVDDGSSDGSDDLLTRHLPHPRMRALRHRANRGYGEAIKAGILRADTEFVATMDADGQHSIEDLNKLLDVMVTGQADLVIGARVGKPIGGNYRQLGKAMIRGLAYVMFGARIRDLNSGMKVYRTELVMRLLPYCPGSMAFSDVATLSHLNLGCKVHEIPIEVGLRSGGRSTIDTMTAVDTALELVNVLMWFRPLKIFIPLSVLLLVAGAVWAVPFLAIGRGLSSVSLLMILTGFICAVLGLIAEQLAATRRMDLSEVLAAELRPRT